MATVGAVTLSVSVVVFVTPPPFAVTVRGKLPVCVEAFVPIVNFVEQTGLQEREEKAVVAFDGIPETLKETA